jgi:hypothetical protein
MRRKSFLVCGLPRTGVRVELQACWVWAANFLPGFSPLSKLTLGGVLGDALEKPTDADYGLKF